MSTHLPLKPGARRQRLERAWPLPPRPAWHRLQRALVATGWAALVLASGSALAAGAQGHAANSGQAADALPAALAAPCSTASTAPDLATCRKEAAAARAEAQHNKLDNGDSPAQRQRHALARCGRLPADQRPACRAMAQGGGEREGSVAEGAVLKQLVTRSDAGMPLPGKPASPASAASAAVAGPPASQPAPPPPKR